MDVREAYEEFLHAKLPRSRATQRGYRIRLNIFASWCEEHALELQMLTAKHVRAFLEDVGMRQGLKSERLAANTVRQYAMTVKNFLSWCSREEEFEELISTKVVSRVALPRAEQVVIETFTPEQLQALFRALEKQPFPVRDKAILSVLIDTGIRASELCGLVLNCVWLDADDSYIKVLGKGRKEREIPLGRASRIALRRYITRYRGKPRNQAEQHVFLSRTGEPLTVHGLAELIEHLGEHARIKGVRCSPHTFRHTFACQYLLNGGDIYKLSRLMGHTSVKITERYLQAVNAKQVRRESHSVLDNL
jgi:site-specific recombinase XerD